MIRLQTCQARLGDPSGSSGVVTRETVTWTARERNMYVHSPGQAECCRVEGSGGVRDAPLKYMMRLPHLTRPPHTGITTEFRKLADPGPTLQKQSHGMG